MLPRTMRRQRAAGNAEASTDQETSRLENVAACG